MNLLSNPDAKAEFERDPQGVLAQHGLDNVCGQDVRDAQPLLADHPNVHATSAFGHHPGGDDPIREIRYVSQHYEVDRSVTNNHYDVSYVDDRDTTNINAHGDVTVTDSFNQDNDVSVTQDSNNYDNHGVDNRGGEIDHSVVGGHDVNDSGNAVTHTAVDGSFDTDNSHTNVDASDDHSVDHSFNDDHHAPLHGAAESDLHDATDLGLHDAHPDAALTAV
jgi:hypothetical protein